MRISNRVQKNIIEIPRMDLVRKARPVVFKSFDLDTGFNFRH